MKKLIALAVFVGAAMVANAATFDWSTTSKLYGVVAADVLDNGSYAVAASGTTDRGDKVLTLTYVLSILDTSGATVGSASGSVAYGSLGKVSTGGIEVAGAAQGTEYKYVLTLTGSQSNLSSRGDKVESGDYVYDYTSAILTATLEGDIKTATMGNTDLGNIVPSSWTVSGITKTSKTTPVDPGDGPEPTSGLLLAVGGAMLALRRKRA